LNRWKKREQKKLLSEFCFLCTVKNNRRKFVDSALRKSIFFVHSDVHVGNFTVQKIQSFFMQISEDPVNPSKFPHEHQNEQKILIFSARNPQIFDHYFSQCRERNFRESANYHLAIPGLSPIKIFFDSLCE
jgi:hypothetical protein